MGKSTFINLLIGNLHKDKGEIFYDNLNFELLRYQGLDAINIGICPSYNVLSQNLTVYNHLKVISILKRL